MSSRFQAALVFILSILFLPGPILADDQPFNERAFGRYQTVLFANPVEGAVMDRFWEEMLRGDQLGEFQAKVARLAATGDYAGAMLLGHLRRRLGDPHGATVAYRLATLARPNEKPGWLQLANSHETLGELKEAAETLRKASRELAMSGSDSVALLRESARLFTAAGEPDAAAETWETIVELRPEDPDVRLELARQYQIAGRDEEAIAALTAATESGSPRNRVMAYRELARLQQFHQNNSAAGDAIEAALSLMSADHWLHAELVEQLIRFHQIDGKSEDLEERWLSAIERNPRDTEAIRKLLHYYRLELNTSAEAVWLERLLALVPSREDFRARYAEALWELGRLEDSAEQFHQLAEERPGNAEYQFKLAEIDLQQQKEDQAVQRLETLRESPRSAEAVTARVLDFYQRNRLFEAAERIFRERLAASDWASVDVATLADYYLQHAELDEASDLLQQWIDRATTDQERFDRMLASAVRYQDANRMPAALQLLVQANEMRSGHYDLLIRKAEILLAMGREEQARLAAHEAYAAASNETERAYADDHLLQTYQRRGASTLANQGFLTGGPVNSALTAFIETLRLRAEKDGEPKDWLRLARWQTWTRNRPEAIRALRKAMSDMAPPPVELLKTYAKLLADENQARYAIEQYQRLAELDPENAFDYQREVARLEGVLNNWNAAVAVLEDLVEDHPASLTALADLARTYQMAGDDEQALEAWERAYLLEDRSGSNRDVLQPYVSMLEEAGEHEKVIRTYEREIQTTNDSARQWSLFSAALQYAERNSLLAPMRERYAARLRAQPADPFLQSATAALLQREGEEGRAFALLESSSLASPDPSRALKTLVETAVSDGRLHEAILHQRRLVMLSRQDTREDTREELRKLAELQEANFEFRDAASTWGRLAARNPRDIEILRAAAEFFLRLGNDQAAQPLLEEVARLDPGMLTPQLALGYLEAGGGHWDQAIAAFRSVIERGPQRPRTAALLPPGGEGDEQKQAREAIDLQNLKALFASGGDGDYFQQEQLFQSQRALERLGAQPEDARLEAIRAMALIYRAPQFQKEKQAWIESWRALEESQPTEALWAYYYTGAGKEALRLAEQRSRDGQREELPIYVYVQLAIRLGEIEQLPEWIWSRDLPPVLLADVALTALIQQLAIAPETIEPEWIDRLLPPEKSHSTSRLQAAAVAASRGRYDLAAYLADQLWETNRAEVVDALQELGEWQIRVGHPERFQEMIEQTVDSVGGSFRAGRGFALRTDYLRQPDEAARRAWLNERREKAAEAGLFDRAMTTLILAGLDQSPQAIEEAAEFLVQHRLTSPNSEGITDMGTPADDAPWELLLEVVETLRQIGLESTAQTLRQTALADRAWLALASEDAENMIQALAMQTVVEALAGKSLERIRFYMAGPEFLQLPPASRFNPGGEWLQRGEGITAGRWHWALAEKLGGSAEHTRQMIVAYRASNEWKELAESLEAYLDRRPMREHPSTLQRDVVTSLIESWERLGLYGLALELLAEQSRLPLSAQITRAGILRELDREAEADELLEGLRERHQTSPLVKEAYADLLIKQGRKKEALDVLLSIDIGERGLANQRAIKAVKLLADVGEEPLIQRFAREFARAGEYEALIVLLERAAPELRGWLFQVALTVATRTESAPPLELMRLEELLKVAPDNPAFWQVARQLEDVAANRGVSDRFYEIMAEEAVRRSLDDQWLQELERRANSAGNEMMPWFQLVRFALQQEQMDIAERATRHLLKSRWLAAELATEVAEQLLKADQIELAVALLDKSLRFGAGSAKQMALRYRMAIIQGDGAKAAELRDQLIAWGYADTEGWLELALAMETAGDRLEAMDALEEWLPIASSGKTALADALVRMALDANDFDRAIRHLSEVSDSAGPELVERLVATSLRFDMIPALIRKAGLDPLPAANLQLALFDRALAEDRFEVAVQLLEQSPLLLARATQLRRDEVSQLAEQPGITERLRAAAASLPPQWADPAAKKFTAELPVR